jgi:hypothetical protein
LICKYQFEYLYYLNMPDYHNGKMSVLGVPPCLRYYGSTVQTLEARMRTHKQDARAYLKGRLKGKCYSKELVLRPGCKIELVEDFPCSSKQELERREGWYQINNQCVNRYVAGRTKKEYQKKYNEDNKEKHALYNKEYWKANKEKIRNDKKQKVVCEICGSAVSKSYMTGHKKTKKCLSTTKKDKQPERTYTEGGLAMLRDFGE